MSYSTAIDPSRPHSVKIGEIVLIPFVGQHDKLTAFRWPFYKAARAHHFLETSAQSAVSKVPVLM